MEPKIYHPIHSNRVRESFFLWLGHGFMMFMWNHFVAIDLEFFQVPKLDFETDLLKKKSPNRHIFFLQKSKVWKEKNKTSWDAEIVIRQRVGDFVDVKFSIWDPRDLPICNRYKSLTGNCAEGWKGCSRILGKKRLISWRTWTTENFWCLRKKSPFLIDWTAVIFSQKQPSSPFVKSARSPRANTSGTGPRITEKVAGLCAGAILRN